jgi:hypothetical protein
VHEPPPKLTERRLLAPRRRPPAVLVQLAGVWTAGALLGIPLGVRLVYGLFLSLWLVPVTIACMAVVLYPLGLATPAASSLTRTRGGRYLWALLVAGGGFVIWLVAAVFLREAGARFGDPDLGWWLLSGLPFALTAGVLATGWTRWVALALAVVAVAASLRVLDSRADSEAAARRPHVPPTPRAVMLVTDLPGYRITLAEAGAGLGEFALEYQPIDRPLTGQQLVDSVVFFWVERGSTTPPDCDPGLPQVTARDVPPRRCVAERRTLWYLHTSGAHEYVLQRDGLLIHASGNLPVDRDLLRRAVLAARAASDAELTHILPPDITPSWRRKVA